MMATAGGLAALVFLPHKPFTFDIPVLEYRIDVHENALPVAGTAVSAVSTGAAIIAGATYLAEGYLQTPRASSSQMNNRDPGFGGVNYHRRRKPFIEMWLKSDGTTPTSTPSRNVQDPKPLYKS